MTKEYNTVDLFAGAGGMSFGFEQSNSYQPMLGVEVDEEACQTYRRNISAPCLQEDLTEYLPEDAPIHRAQVDCITGGPPCQDFSVANYYSRGGGRTNLVFVFADWIEHYEPELFVMENVAGITSVGTVFEDLLDTFESLGYTASAQVCNAEDFGVPQRRNRMIIVGFRSGSFDFGELATTEPKSVSEAFEGLPQIEAGETDDSIPNHRAPNHQQKTIERISGTDYGEQLFDSWTEKIRLDPTLAAPTLKAGKRANYHFGHPEVPRGLTIRERARLQGFPDEFVFEGTVTGMRTQTGNAVPVPMATAIADAVAEQYQS